MYYPRRRNKPSPLLVLGLLVSLAVVVTAGVQASSSDTDRANSAASEQVQHPFGR